jgi:hypothetical protein
MENWTDLLVGVCFFAIGVGLYTATMSRKRRPVILCLIGAIFILNMIWVGGVPGVDANQDQPVITKAGFESELGIDQPTQIRSANSTGENTAAQRRSVYWNKTLPMDCHSEDFIYRQVPPSDYYCSRLPR